MNQLLHAAISHRTTVPSAKLHPNVKDIVFYSVALKPLMAHSLYERAYCHTTGW